LTTKPVGAGVAVGVAPVVAVAVAVRVAVGDGRAAALDPPHAASETSMTAPRICGTARNQGNPWPYDIAHRGTLLIGVFS
jgi:hypothetical protein